MTLAAMLLDGRYRLDEPIGAGGYCEVWRASDTVLARPVAVKLLHPGYAHQAEARARFQAEARHAGSFSHPNIARVYDYGEPAGGQQPYLIMELVEGPCLAAVLAGGPLDAARTMDVVAQAAAGLQAAHSAGLIHRDIKPANILFAPRGTVKITDFGIAHAIGSAPVTASGIVMGTPGYIAPERVTGAHAGPACDLYALGIVAYECLAGTRPFTGSALDVALAHRDRPLPPLPDWVPADVVALVMNLTAKDPAWRPGSAAKVAFRAGLLRDSLRGRRPGGTAAGPGGAWHLRSMPLDLATAPWPGPRPDPSRPAPADPSRPAPPDPSRPAPADPSRPAPASIAAGRWHAAPDLPRRPRAHAGRIRDGRVPVVAAVAVAALTGLGMAGMAGFASGSHAADSPASVPAAAPFRASQSVTGGPHRHAAASRSSPASRVVVSVRTVAPPAPGPQGSPPPGSGPQGNPPPGPGPQGNPPPGPGPKHGHARGHHHGNGGEGNQDAHPGNSGSVRQNV